MVITRATEPRNPFVRHDQVRSAVRQVNVAADAEIPPLDVTGDRAAFHCKNPLELSTFKAALLFALSGSTLTFAGARLLKPAFSR